VIIKSNFTQFLYVSEVFMARHVLLVKSHVSAFTRKDGTFVAAHDDKRTKAAKPVAEHPIPSKPSGIPDNYHSTLDYLASKTQGFIKTDPQAGLDFLYKQKNNWKKDTSEAEHAPKVIKYISELINHLTAAASSAGDSPAHDDKRTKAASSSGNIGDSERAQYGDHFKEGDKVKDNYGKHHEVLSHVGAEVKTKGGESFHPTKVHRVK
jgi:hypothetical protein